MNAEERAAFRAFVREHHPDRGGDPEVFATGMARFAGRARPAPEPAPAPSTPSTPEPPPPAADPVDPATLPFPVRVGIALIRTWHHHRRSQRADPPAEHP